MHDLAFLQKWTALIRLGKYLQIGRRLADLERRSRKVAHFVDVRMETLISGWIGIVLIFAFLKVLTAPTPAGSLTEGAAMLLPFILLAAAPVLGYRVAAGSFPKGRLSAQPAFRLARYGAWQPASPSQVSRMLTTGPSGFMVSLIVGIMLNVPVRAMEFLAIVPAINPADPFWAHALVTAMTIDVVVMTFLYMVCFVMALRSIPLFPRMLALAWALDMGIQLALGVYLGSAVDMPAEVTAPLADLLIGNIKKVAISVFIWLPYLLLSDRVNLTFRHRVRA